MYLNIMKAQLSKKNPSVASGSQVKCCSLKCCSLIMLIISGIKGEVLHSEDSLDRIRRVHYKTYLNRGNDC